MPTEEYSKACSTIPVVVSNYTPKGSYQPHGSFNQVYVTGGQADTAVIFIYDIFGFHPQTQQGADITASSLNTRVFMPDFFEPHGSFPAEKIPPKTDEDKQYFQEWIDKAATIPQTVTKLAAYAKFLKQEGYQFVSVVGMCWGGKVAMVAGGDDDGALGAIAIVHPAKLAVEDAEKLTVPLGIYSSNGESREEHEKIVNVISKNAFASKNDHKYWGNMFHGWAAARANLDDPENKEEFANLYARVATFIKGAR